MNKIRAYTIMEMVVVMLLSGIVISISFRSFDILSKSYVDFRNRQAVIAQYATMDRLLLLDFVRAKEIMKTEEGMRVRLSGQDINYIVSHEYIIRTQASVSDTFPMAAKEIFFRFADKTATAPGDMLDELLIENEYKEEQQYFHYRKLYGADVLMEMQKTKLVNN